jgi:hypothetical protein
VRLQLIWFHWLSFVRDWLCVKLRELIVLLVGNSLQKGLRVASGRNKEACMGKNSRIHLVQKIVVLGTQILRFLNVLIDLLNKVVNYDCRLQKLRIFISQKWQVCLLSC